MKMFYRSRSHDTSMIWSMRVFIALAIFLCAIPAAGALSVSINASQQSAHIGDMIVLNGNVSGIHTIAVYLFVTGPGLDPRGVTLENFNIPAGRGLFTTAPVNMDTETWQYQWDTSVTLGEMRPGKYMVYVVSSPLDRQRFAPNEYAVTEINILPSEKPTTEIALSPFTTVAALVITGIAGCFVMHRMKK
jgi:hypothetical protein